MSSGGSEHKGARDQPVIALWWVVSVLIFVVLFVIF